MTDGRPDGLRAELQRFYGTNETYLEVLRKPLSMSPSERERYWRGYVALVAAAAPSPASRILDLGCGTGRTSESLAELGFRVVAADWSDLLIRAGIAERDRRRSARYVLADAERLPFSDASFDVVASLDLIEHTLTPETVLAEASRVLAPSGVLVVKCPNLLSPLRPLWYLMRLILLRGSTPVWGDNVVVALRGLAFNTLITASKLLLGRPGFLPRAPTLTGPALGEDADATYYACAIDIRRWLATNGFRVTDRASVANDNLAQRLVRRLVPDLASPIAIVARRRA